MTLSIMPINTVILYDMFLSVQINGLIIKCLLFAYWLI